MKYKNFYEWFNTKDYSYVSKNEKTLMQIAWDAAVNGFPEDPITVKIKELLTTINNAEKIDCTCDQIQIATGYRCGCGKNMALQQAGKELGKYLRKLRKGLK